MKGFIFTIFWDVVFGIGLFFSYVAQNRFGANEVIVLTVLCFFVGVMICVLGIGGISNAELAAALLPALYIMLAPFVGSWINGLLNLPFTPVPQVLMGESTLYLRYACAAVSGYALFERFRPY